MSSRVTTKGDMSTRLRRNDDHNIGRSKQPSNRPRPRTTDTVNEVTPPPVELSSEFHKIYSEFMSTEKYIRNFLTEREFSQVVEDRKKLTRAITSLFSSCSDLLSSSLTDFARLNIDYRFWKSSVHQIVHAGRIASASKPSAKPEIQKLVSFFLEKGLKHMEELRDAVVKKCPYTRNQLTGGADYFSSCPEGNKAAKDCHPRILISIGDTHRYANSLKLAMDSYEQARSIDPGNGTAYHQLGLMALLQRDFLSAAYDFLRATSSPADSVDGATAQLQIAFDEALKVYNRSSATFWFQCARKPEDRKSDSNNIKEVWIFRKGDKVPPVPEELDTKESHWKKVEEKELSHRFYLTFVLVIGKLWTNVGTENLNVLAEECLVYLEGLLQRGSTFLPLRILQVVSLLLMLLDHLRPKGSSNPVWTTAIQFSLEIFTIMCARLAKLIDLCDWDSPQLDTLAVGVSTFVTWMEHHEKDWKSRHPRPVFSAKYCMKSKDDFVQDRLDHVWTTFASLMTKLTWMFRRFKSSLFPSVVSDEDEERSKVEHKVLLSPFPEAKHMYGLAGLAKSSLLKYKYFCDSKLRSSRGRNYIRLNNIFRFGLIVLYEKCKILELKTVNDVEQFSSRVKVKSTYVESEVGGLDNHHMLNLDKNCTIFDINQSGHGQFHQNLSISQRFGDVNSCCRILLKKQKKLDNDGNPADPDQDKLSPVSAIKMDKVSPVSAIKMDKVSPVSAMKIKAQTRLSKKVKRHKRTLKMWEQFTKEGLATDIVIEPTNFVLDTNCFVRKLGMIKVLICLATRPLLIPVSVVLELKGLSKGGLRKQDQVRYGSDVRNAVVQQKLVDGQEVGERCLEALTFIADNMNYFRVITSSGTVLKIRTPHAFVKDDSFDPSDNNDDRILQSCRKLEELDLCLRDKDTFRRIYRRTVLLTSDRCLRLKSNLCYYIPARPITPVVFWLISQCSIKFYVGVTRSFTNIRDKRFQKRREKRDMSKALRKAASPLPREPETKVRAILPRPELLMLNKSFS